MKTASTFAAFATALALAAAAAAPVLAAGDHNHAGDHHHAGDDHKPMHGGVVVASKLYDYELVATPTAIHLHLRDHGKAADVSKASARLTLLTGTDTQQVDLQPAGDKLQAVGTFKVAPGTKAVAAITVAGKSVGTVRFTLPATP